jgi:cell division septal protein FtsQ
MKSDPKPAAMKVLLVCVVIGIIIGLICTVRFGINVFQVKHIEVSGDLVQIEINKSIFVNNLLFFPSEATEKQLKSENPLIKAVEIRKKFPSTLEFVIYKRTPVATLLSAGIPVGIDEECVVTEMSTDSNIPVISITVPLVRIGGTIKDPMVVQAMSLLVKTARIFRWSTIQSYETQSIRAKTGQTDILITQTSDLSQIVDTLQTLMEGFRIKGTIPKSIDLRFGKPIVQF